MDESLANLPSGLRYVAPATLPDHNPPEPPGRVSNFLQCIPCTEFEFKTPSTEHPRQGCGGSGNNEGRTEGGLHDGETIRWREVADLGTIIEWLDSRGRLVRVRSEVDPAHQLAAIAAKFERGPRAVFFEKVKGSRYPVFTGLYWSRELLGDLFGRAAAALPQLVSDTDRAMAATARCARRRRPGRSCRSPNPAWTFRHAGPDTCRERCGALSRRGGGHRQGPGNGQAQHLDPAVPGGRQGPPGDQHRCRPPSRDLPGQGGRAGRAPALHAERRRRPGPAFRGRRRRPRRRRSEPTSWASPASSRAAAGTGGRHHVAVEMVADAMFALECEMVPGEVHEEGPFAEVTGYYASVAPRPLVRVKKIHRRAPAGLSDHPLGRRGVQFGRPARRGQRAGPAAEAGAGRAGTSTSPTAAAVSIMPWCSSRKSARAGPSRR